MDVYRNSRKGADFTLSLDGLCLSCQLTTPSLTVSLNYLGGSGKARLMAGLLFLLAVSMVALAMGDIGLFRLILSTVYARLTQ